MDSEESLLSFPLGLSIPALRVPSALSSDQKVRILLKIDNLNEMVKARNINKEYRVYTEIEKCQMGGQRLNDLVWEKHDIENSSEFYLIPEFIKFFLKDKRVDPTVNDNWPIRWAAQNGHTEVVKMLLEWEGENGERVDLIACDNYAIIAMVRNRDIKMLKLLNEKNIKEANQKMFIFSVLFKELEDTMNGYVEIFEYAGCVRAVRDILKDFKFVNDNL